MYPFYPATMNGWQYSMFPFGTSQAIMYPQDSLSNENDKALFNFNYMADSMLEQTTKLKQYVEYWQKYQQAQLSNWWNNTMGNMSSNINFDFSNNMLNPFNPGITPGSGVTDHDKEDTMNDKDVWKYMARLRHVDTLGDKFLEEVETSDGVKSTYEKMLVKLCKDYVTEETPELSDSEFQQCKEIAIKLKSTGEIDKSDWQDLKAIVDAHLGSNSSEESDSENSVQDGKVSRTPEHLEAILAEGGFAPKAIANDFYEAIDGAGTDKSLLQSATNSTNKYNVIEVLTAFEKQSSVGGSFIDRLLDDCDNWNARQGGQWYCFGFDDDTSKPFVSHLADCMSLRAKGLIKLSNCTPELKKQLEDASTALNNYITHLDETNEVNDNLTDEQKKELASKFDTLKKVIKNAEEELYCELE